jgi:hypothetical protein
VEQSSRTSPDGDDQRPDDQRLDDAVAEPVVPPAVDEVRAAIVAAIGAGRQLLDALEHAVTDPRTVHHVSERLTDLAAGASSIFRSFTAAAAPAGEADPDDGSGFEDIEVR